MIRPRYSQADRAGNVSGRFVEQVAREVLRLQREVYPPGSDPRGKGLQYGLAAWAGAQMAIVTTAITAASSLTYGSGAVQLHYSVNPGDVAATPDPDVASYPVINWYTSSGTIGTGKHCFVFATSAGLTLLIYEC
jgi:hypothetical protein